MQVSNFIWCKAEMHNWLNFLIQDFSLCFFMIHLLKDADNIQWHKVWCPTFSNSALTSEGATSTRVNPGYNTVSNKINGVRSRSIKHVSIFYKTTTHVIILSSIQMFMNARNTLFHLCINLISFVWMQKHVCWHWFALTA